ncbi:hypothetical protein F6X40_11175 [Paraburkholderia sp. UCT31]|uniref:HAD domain-containing protein n=1 Tax=Paraburkholderia sp. UCT31 TaxID=2615209 RepID=UPI001655E494|nr:HAD domain-containing protein [Paraburkholderia sp. UCT31]MBC8737365.1 hypothetical protein [Paraburkholderia sp. UCT31]
MNLIFLNEQVLRGLAVRFIDGAESLQWDPTALRLLDRLCEAANARLVVCSDQQQNESRLEPWNERFRAAGSRHIEVVGLTPVLCTSDPGVEVLTFLKTFAGTVTRYVILDSRPGYLVWQPHLRAERDTGLTARLAYEALAQLNAGSPLLAEWQALSGYGDLLSL